MDSSPRILGLLALALSTACVTEVRDESHRALMDETAGPAGPTAGAEDGGDPTAAEDGGGSDAGSGETCADAVAHATHSGSLPNGFTPHPSGGVQSPLSAEQCIYLMTTGQEQAYCDAQFNAPLGIGSDPATFFSLGAGQEMICGCACDEVPVEVGACEDLEAAIEDGTLPWLTMASGVALFPHSGEFCENLSPESGQSTCDWKVANEIGQPFGSFPYTTVEIDGELHCGCACDDPNACPDPEIAHEYVWIPSGSYALFEPRLSKIRASDGVEVARYRTSEIGFGPSRVGVSLNGVAAVASRHGGVVAIAQDDACPDPANTSTGPGDVLDFPDGCVLWHLDSPWPLPTNNNSNRPLAWTPGEWDPQTCRFENTKVWTAQVGDGLNQILRLDGDTGEVDLTVSTVGIANPPFGIYGGVSDAEGTFWSSVLGADEFIRVDSSGSLTVIPAPEPVTAYGNTIDASGRPFLCGAQRIARYDPATDTWATNDVGAALSPCAFDGESTIYLRDASANIIGVDVDSLEVVETLAPPPQVFAAHGFGFDFEGGFWVLGNGSQSVWRYDGTGADPLEVPLPGLPYSYNEFAGRRLAAVAGF